MAHRTEGSTGVRVPVSPPTDFTGDVLTDVVLERHRQIALWGHNEDTSDGTGPRSQWALPLVHFGGESPRAEWGYGKQNDADIAEEVLRDAYDLKVQAGQQLAWVDFLLEEVAEAFKEDDPAKLYAELVQVAAVAVSWCEKIRQR